jgi:hypothetical protein
MIDVILLPLGVEDLVRPRTFPQQHTASGLPGFEELNHVPRCTSF